MKNAVVIGYGSIGKLHCNILKQLGFDLRIVSNHSNDGENVFRNIAEACDGSPDYVVIASPTHKHHDHLSQVEATGYAGKILIEKPLFAKVETVSAKSRDNVFVGYNLRYFPGMIELREALRTRTPFCVHHYVGQHLSLWRPDADHLTSYSACAAKGGGVLRDLSHELDLMRHLFGKPLEIKAMGGKVGSVTIDSEDAFGILIKTEQCPLISLQMNYLDWQGTRSLRIVCDDMTAVLDFKEGILSLGNTLHNFEIDRETSYRRMHEDILSQQPQFACNFSEGLDVVSMIETLEQQ